MDAHEKKLAVKEVERKIYAWIQENYPDGIEIYADYRDEISPDSVKRIIDSAYPSDAFNEWLDAAYDDYGEQVLYEEFQKMMNFLDIPCELEKDEHYWWDFFRDYCWYCVPAEHYLSQTFCCDILVDTETSASHEPLISWLAQKQGYTQSQLQNALASEDDSSNFLSSVREEIRNVTNNYNCLVFCKKFALEELLMVIEEHKTIKISAKTNCGLFNPWDGSGSILGIELEKDMEIDYSDPAHIVTIMLTDTNNRLKYTVNQVYGLMSSFWKE